jgi:hypothetical protein
MLTVEDIFIPEAPDGNSSRRYEAISYERF